MLSVLVSLVPSVAPAGLFPEDAVVAETGDEPSGDDAMLPDRVLVGDDDDDDADARPPPAPAPDVPTRPAANESGAANESTPPPANVTRAPAPPPPPPFAAWFTLPEFDTSAGSVVPLTLVVENRHEWHLSIGVSLKDVTTGWRGAIGEERLELAPGDKAHVNGYLEAPQNAAPGDTGTLRVTLSTPFPPTVVVVSASGAVPVPDVHRAVSINNPEGNKFVESGGFVEYPLRVTNYGDAFDSIRVVVPSGPSGWSASLSAASVRLDPGQSADVVLTVTAPASAEPDEGAFFNVTAISNSDPDVAAMTTTLTVVDDEQGGSALTNLANVCFRLPPEAATAQEAAAPERFCIDARPYLAPLANEDA